MSKEITVGIVTYNSAEKAKNACASILENTKKYKPTVYVFDNNSTEDMSPVSKIDGVIFKKQDGNIGFGAAHNKILNEKIGDYHFVVNPDITVSDDVLSDMVDFMEENPDIVMAMPNIRNEDGSIQYLPKEVPTFKNVFLGRFSKSVREKYIWKNKDTNDVTDINFCTGCFFVMRGETFKTLGGFDDRYFMYFEDVDLTLRAKKLGRTVIAPQFSVNHLWARESAKSIKYLLIHIHSAFKFFFKKRSLVK